MPCAISSASRPRRHTAGGRLARTLGSAIDAVLILRAHWRTAIGCFHASREVIDALLKRAKSPLRNRPCRCASRDLSAGPRSAVALSAAGAARLGSSVSARSAARSVVVGASRRRAAPRIRFVGALPSDIRRLRSPQCRQRKGSPPLQLNYLNTCHRNPAEPNPSLKRTANGVPPWPRGRVGYHRPRGQGATPLAAA